MQFLLHILEASRSAFTHHRVISKPHNNEIEGAPQFACYNQYFVIATAVIYCVYYALCLRGDVAMEMANLVRVFNFQFLFCNPQTIFYIMVKY